jgi:hypothetical protein
MPPACPEHSVGAQLDKQVRCCMASVFIDASASAIAVGLLLLIVSLQLAEYAVGSRHTRPVCRGGVLAGLRVK